MWFGAGAAELGLTGAVQAGDFSHVLAGFSPDGNRQLVQNAGSAVRRSGWDLTFSAPKSVSTLFSQADEVLRGDLLGIHTQAVLRTLTWIEKTASFSRIGKDGAVSVPAGVTGVCISHTSSRLGDPQLHAHCLLMNIGAKGGGSFGSLAAREIYRIKMAAGSIYRAELAYLLQVRLGLAIQRNGALFELEGVPTSLMTAFSTRRKQIVAALAATGYSGAKASAVATLATRPAKEVLPAEELFQSWRQTGLTYGFSEGQAQALLNRTVLKSDVSAVSEQVLSEALDAITAQTNTFTEADLLRRLAEVTPGSGLNCDAITGLAAQYLGCSDAIKLSSGRHPIYTTREIVQVELELLTIARRLKLGAFPSVPTAQVSHVLETAGDLNDEQKTAIKYATSTTGNIHVILGFAGTGKTVTLRTITETYRAFGHTVIGAAPTGRAALNLEQEAGILSGTLHSLLANGSLDSRTVLIVDEAGLINTRSMSDLLNLVEASGCSVILVGDHKQLQPIGSGGPLAALAKVCGHSDLTSIVRQQNIWAREAVSEVIAGNIEPALMSLAEHGCLHLSADRRSAIEDLVNHWAAQDARSQTNSLILAGTRHDVRLLNQLCQAALRKRGRLGNEILQTEHHAFSVGDRVMVTKNCKPLGIVNGGLATVIRVEAATNTLVTRLDTGRTISISLAHFPHVELGYAITTHKSQGQTVDRAFVLLGGDMCDRELSYVQLSRARMQTTLFIDSSEAGPDLQSLIERMAESHQKRLAVETLKGGPLSLQASPDRIRSGVAL